jgi:hypothetical protein
VSEDWRVRIELQDEGRVHGLVDAVRDGRVTSQARERLNDAVVISRDGPEIFLYAGSERDARSAEAVLREVLGSRADEATFTCERWHDVEERWEPCTEPLPQTADEIAAEERRRDQDEATESKQAGAPLWEVRIELPDRAAAAALEERLEAEGIQVVRRHSYVLVGAASEGDAQALRTRLSELVPPEASLSVEGSATASELETSRRGLFAVFGGLAG